MRELIKDESWLKKNLTLPLSQHHIGSIISEMENRLQAGQFNTWERTMTPPCSFLDYVSDILCKLGEHSVAIAQLVMEGRVPPQPTDLVVDSEYQSKVTLAVSGLRRLVLNISFDPHTIAMVTVPPCWQRSAFASIISLLASGPRLQALALDLDRQLSRRFCMLIARSRQSLRSLRSLHLRMALFRLEELRAFMDSLGPDIKDVTLGYTSPSIEEYAGGLDMMRRRREAAAPECRFGLLECLLPRGLWSEYAGHTEESDRDRDTHDSKEMLKRCMLYINGGAEENPRICSCAYCLEEWESGVARIWFDSADEE